jgi:pyruvate formate lyase activating enzyme
MIIGGFQGVTLSDFPGRVAAIVFTQGCNFRCPWCHNKPLLPCKTADEFPQELCVEAIKENIKSRVKLIQGVVVSGGEPTLQAGLEDFLRYCKGLGLETKLDTNGSNPKVISRLLKECLVDYIAMDIKAPFDKYEQLTGVPVDCDQIQETMDLIVESGVQHHFRTTVVEEYLGSEELDKIRKMIPPTSVYKLQAYINPQD